MMQTAPDVISIFEKLGTPVAFVLLGTWIFYKVIWPAKLKREDRAINGDETLAIHGIIDYSDLANTAYTLKFAFYWRRGGMFCPGIYPPDPPPEEIHYT